MSDIEYLRELVETPSPAGREGETARSWAARIDGEQTVRDAYGNTRVSVATDGAVDVGVFVHLDTVGYTVRRITDDGFIYVQRLGGVDPSLARSGQVEIHGRDGPVRGVFGSKSFHLTVKESERETPDIGDIWIDIGATDREAVEAAGVHVGAPVTHVGRLAELTGERVTGAGLDNAAGAWIVAETLRGLAPEDVNVSVHGYATTQTEIQHFGAKYLSAPELDLAVVVDVTFATGTPPIRERKRGAVRLGEGPVVRHNREHHPAVVDVLDRAAARVGTSIQHEPVDTKGGERRTVYETTDAAYLSKQLHVPVAFLGIPCRYIHSPREVVDRRDLDGAVSTLGSFLRTVDPDDVPTDAVL